VPKPLHDVPLGDDRLTSDYAAQKRETEKFLAMLEEMEEDPAYLWAFDTVSGIKASVGLNSSVTPGQREAILNIRRAKEQREDRPRGKSRRYEGWDRGGW
jgi:hypothetical protein